MPASRSTKNHQVQKEESQPYTVKKPNQTQYFFSEVPLHQYLFTQESLKRYNPEKKEGKHLVLKRNFFGWTTGCEFNLVSFNDPNCFMKISHLGKKWKVDRFFQFGTITSNNKPVPLHKNNYATSIDDLVTGLMDCTVQLSDRNFCDCKLREPIGTWPVGKEIKLVEFPVNGTSRFIIGDIDYFVMIIQMLVFSPYK